jgi:hypothetical protein
MRRGAGGGVNALPGPDLDLIPELPPLLADAGDPILVEDGECQGDESREP